MTHPRSAIDAIADDYLATTARLDPLFATEAGIAGYDHLLTDFGPTASAELADVARNAIAQLSATTVIDDVDRVTVATMVSTLGRQLALFDAGESVGTLNVIASPLQAVRDSFDLLPIDTAEQREIFVERLRAIPACVDSIIDGLDHRFATGPPLARRQIGLVAAQSDSAADGIAVATRPILADDALRGAASDALDAAAAAFGGLGTRLRAGLESGVDADGIGRDRYLLHLPAYLGTDVDPVEAYQFGLDRLSQIIAEQREVANQLGAEGDIAAAIAILNADKRYQIDSGEEFVAWMQELSDRTVSALSGVHFDLPDRLSRLECRLAPSSTGAIYYTQPSADLSRPGRMWWSVPAGQKVFHTWLESTTVFHEGVPGHHLQLGSAVVSEELNDWRKLASFTSGHGEGWALYAERLMGDLGWLDDPGDRMGMLDSQRLRAARVVVDIGVHCGLAAPESVGGGTWDADKAWAFLTDAVAMDREVLRFELDRYLGWPGQAPSYALGQRVWEQTRDAALAAHPDWTLREFHTRALRLGGVTLDVLRDELG
ncbi:hypothetical protein GOEFS_050_00340 [Gordonia effusa NBRC 100432]|uniref:DUF885 domain-containing protein n=1 Tax=Gordonia effusa NBRC 100432 TaxID=1077974 RepID=H0QZK5_9ACTN|nr:DUF885 domain-containing protein [Gordonia effusa]GAB18256.1 hypothetical protein GOEFS_050_00340 [Gordonia effusa NBRC 100432]